MSWQVVEFPSFSRLHCICIHTDRLHFVDMFVRPWILVLLLLLGYLNSTAVKMRVQVSFQDPVFDSLGIEMPSSRTAIVYDNSGLGVFVRFI